MGGAADVATPPRATTISRSSPKCGDSGDEAAITEEKRVPMARLAAGAGSGDRSVRFRLCPANRFARLLSRHLLRFRTPANIESNLAIVFSYAATARSCRSGLHHDESPHDAEAAIGS
jgi:hypothetical protein